MPRHQTRTPKSEKRFNGISLHPVTPQPGLATKDVKSRNNIGANFTSVLHIVTNNDKNAHLSTIKDKTASSKNKEMNLSGDYSGEHTGKSHKRVDIKKLTTNKFYERRATFKHE
jgi:hypothetical protein